VGGLLDIVVILAYQSSEVFSRSWYIDEIIGLGDFVLITGTKWTLMPEHCRLGYQ